MNKKSKRTLVAIASCFILSSITHAAINHQWGSMSGLVPADRYSLVTHTGSVEYYVYTVGTTYYGHIYPDRYSITLEPGEEATITIDASRTADIKVFTNGSAGPTTAYQSAIRSMSMSDGSFTISYNAQYPTLYIYVGKDGIVADPYEPSYNINYTLTSQIEDLSQTRPDLAPHTPPDWEDAIIVSTTSGSYSNSSPILTTDQVYVAFALANFGLVDSGAFDISLYIDNSLYDTWSTSGFGSMSWGTVENENIGTLPAGTHTLHLVIDPADNILEASEDNNIYEVDILISNPPRVGYSGGEGTPENPYLISILDDLLYLAETEEDYDNHYRLTTNLDLSGLSFEAALIAPDDGSDYRSYTFLGAAFTGSFDGEGHTISNLFIESNSGNYFGLFGSIEGAVSNLSLAGLSMNVRQRAGGLCGHNAGIISNCKVSGEATSRGAYHNATLGGLCGWNSGTISYSSANCNSVSTNGNSGGLCGWNSGTIKQCYATGNSISSTGLNRSGGLCGSNSGTIADCFATGNASSSHPSIPGSSWAGGLTGSNSGTIQRSYSTGYVSASGPGTVSAKGLCAENTTDYGGGIIEDCYWDVDTSGVSYTSGGGAGVSTSQMKVQSNFIGWDFSNIWKMNGYPALQHFNALSIVDFNDWLVAENIPIEFRGENHCPSGDHIPNLLKYACGLPAMSYCESEDLFTYSINASNALFSIIYKKSKSTTQVAVFPEYCTSLTNSSSWSTSEIQESLITSDSSNETWEASVTATNSCGFIRLKAEKE